MRGGSPSGVRRRFRRLFRPRGQVAHVLLTLPPLAARRRPVRLACLIHAASVHSEPGSNSPSLKSHGRATRGPCRFNFFLEELTPGGEPHGVSSFQFPISLSFAHIALPGFQRAGGRAKRAPPLSRFLLYTASGLFQARASFFNRLSAKRRDRCLLYHGFRLSQVAKENFLNIFKLLLFSFYHIAIIQ